MFGGCSTAMELITISAIEERARVWVLELDQWNILVSGNPWL